ncbi:hypothetical protein NP590_07045 [Methylomonas sp. SURF-2]|uniref:PEP-CTERM protein-sorting domain-containing protein n=1 Tax=Methylomonas subterranea TaxID=2952225 RepID=A0ABT1TEG5_9GAMM|nr:hypothetical protein [Methylomonas sp. SURF-2]MCQ8103855.1 hypothetical protein [Methylomonas sp. SURF-2]
MKLNKINGLLMTGFLAAVTPLSAVDAANIVVNYSGSAILNGQQVGYQYGQIAPNPASSGLRGVGIGGIGLTTHDTDYLFSSAGVFNAWCVDIYNWMSTGTSVYNVETGSELAGLLTGLRPGPFDGAQRVNDLLGLANTVYSTLATRVDSAAFQLAVWAITYGTPDQNGQYRITANDPGFRVDAHTAISEYVAMANDWLANLDVAARTGNFTLTYLSDAGASRSTQNLIVFTPAQLSSTIQSVTVSEPGSFMLILLGWVLFAATPGLEASRKLRYRLALDN